MRNPMAVRASSPEGEDIPREIYGFRPYLLAISASWASAMYGYDSAFIGGTLSLPSFQRTYGLDTASDSAKANLSSNIVSTFQGGAFFGCALSFLVAERFGRRPTLILAAIIFSIGAALQMIGRLDCLYVGRALTGWGVGSSAMILPIYVSECSPALIRGRLVGTFEVMLQAALVCGFWVNYGVNKNISPEGNMQWHIPVAVQFVPAGLLVIFMIPMIESPRWLVSKGKLQDARKNLSWVRNLPQDHAYIDREMSMIEVAIEHEVSSTGQRGNWRQIFSELFQPGVRGRVVLSCGLVSFQNFTGINAINYYSPTIFKSIGFTGTSVGLLATGIFGIVKMAATMLYAAFLVDKLGRRPLLLIGGVGSGIAMFYLAGYSKVSGSFEHIPPMDAGAKTAVAMVYIYALFYGMSWNGIPWLFTSEIIPNRVRTLGMAFCICVQWVTQFIVVYSLPHMVIGITYGTFLFFGACTVFAIIFAWLFIPETKGVQLEDMDLLFGPDVPILASRARDNYLQGIAARALDERDGGKMKATEIEQV
ncbi:Quinate permease [Fusarium oxysporum f. sp. narcissi]|nr:Quinate permease [Fusarium oxysporum f. sp. cepae]RKK31190.1 Quinate permease [Fusarium oxysporum f. sp. cepae]RKK35112.1 Quinate permease [Fusarium oxysporum f. sp. cepae]RYC87327.1 Quinate permease [Fusarium oxysporum f. sp. narcissi]